MKQLLFATQNRGKQAEVCELFFDTGFEVVFPQDIPAVVDLDVVEDGASFFENAAKKARAFAEATSIVAVADDSGICVPALDDFPGIMSDRWHPGTAAEKNTALLEKLGANPNRSARFVTVMVAYDPRSDTTLQAEGIVSGTLAGSQDGQHGFGYDAVFIPDGYTQTFAELGTEIKNRISARTLAAEAIRAQLTQQFK